MPREGKPQDIRVGLVGLGGHGRTIQQAVAEAGAFAVAAVFDVDETEASMAVERFGCDRAASYDALLKRGDLDAVVLVTPNHLHRIQAEAAFNMGLDVFLEKPIANTVADGRAIVEAGEAAGLVLMVGHNMRYGQAARLARRILEDGRLGEIVSVEIHFSSDTGRRLASGSWRLRADQCPLLPIMQLGVHAFDLVHYLLGPVVEIVGYARSVTTQAPVVDNVVAAFRVAGGATGTMVSNYCTRVKFEYRLSGTDGTLECTPHRLRYQASAGDDADEEHDFSADERESYRHQLKAFGEAVRDRVAPETDGWAGLQALAVVEALDEAIQTNSHVPVLPQTRLAQEN